MKNVYKWQLGGNMYLYITDAFDPLIASTQPFIYNSVTEEKTFYDGHTAMEEADDAGIADTVSGLTYEVYATRFEEAKILLQNEGYIYVHLGTPEMYYNVEECSLPKSGYIPTFTATGSAVATEDSDVSGNVCVTRDTGEKSIHFSFNIPTGSQGYQGDRPELTVDLYGPEEEGVTGATYDGSTLKFNGIGTKGTKGIKGVQGLEGKRGLQGLPNTGFTFSAGENGVYPTNSVTSGITGNTVTFNIPKGPQGNKGPVSTNMWKGTQQAYDTLYANGNLENIFYAILNSRYERSALYANEFLLIPNNYYLVRYGGSGFTTNAGPIYVGDSVIAISGSDILRSGNWAINSGNNGNVGTVSLSNNGDTILIAPSLNAVSGSTQEVIIKDASGLKKQNSKITLRKVSVDVFVDNSPYTQTTTYSDGTPLSINVVFSGYTSGEDSFIIKASVQDDTKWNTTLYPDVRGSGLTENGEASVNCCSSLKPIESGERPGLRTNTIRFSIEKNNTLLKTFSIIFEGYLGDYTPTRTDTDNLPIINGGINNGDSSDIGDTTEITDESTDECNQEEE